MNSERILDSYDFSQFKSMVEAPLDISNSILPSIKKKFPYITAKLLIDKVDEINKEKLSDLKIDIFNGDPKNFLPYNGEAYILNNYFSLNNSKELSIILKNCYKVMMEYHRLLIIQNKNTIFLENNEKSIFLENKFLLTNQIEKNEIVIFELLKII